MRPPNIWFVISIRRRRKNLSLGFQATNETRRGRVGIASLCWRSREVVVCFDARVRRRQRLHELSDKPLYIFVYLTTTNLLPPPPSITFTWSSLEDEDERDAFWRSMREALKHDPDLDPDPDPDPDPDLDPHPDPDPDPDPDKKRCRRRFDVKPLLASNQDTRVDDVNSITNSQSCLM